MDATTLRPTPKNFARGLRCGLDVLLWSQKEAIRLMAPFFGVRVTRPDAATARVEGDVTDVRPLTPADVTEAVEAEVEAIQAEITAAEAGDGAVAAAEGDAVVEAGGEAVDAAVTPIAEPGRIDDLTVIDGI